MLQRRPRLGPLLSIARAIFTVMLTKMADVSDDMQVIDIFTTFVLYLWVTFDLYISYIISYNAVMSALDSHITLT